MKENCELCHNLLNGPNPDPISSKITIESPKETKTWEVDDGCASTVYEFILEFREDVRTGFRDQDEAWKLKKNPRFQQRLPEMIE